MSPCQVKSDDSKAAILGDLVVTPVVTEVILAQAYIQMLEENTLDVVFYQARPSLLDFLSEYLTHGRRITLGCFRMRENQAPEFCGLGFAYGAVQMGGFIKAECGMWFSSRQSCKGDNLTFGRMMLEVFFEKYNIDAIFGTTPEANKMALRYSQKLGFSLHGPIPNFAVWRGAMCPAWVSHLSKAEWRERNGR